MQLGIETLISGDGAPLRKRLAGRRIALLGHPASICRDDRGAFMHSLDALMSREDTRLSAAFGPQHGMRGDKQDNMIESPDFRDPVHGIPVFSLYGEVRRPTRQMLDSFDVILIDLQDVGCRIYTYLTTLGYLLEDCARGGKEVWVLDRPNPAGRPVEGMILRKGWESFVGIGELPMRHGLTLGEAARWYKSYRKLDVELTVVEMQGYEPSKGPGYGWPVGELPWVNPSPNAASLNMARCFAGTVMIEGATVSEGRGTTIPLEVMGAPDIDIRRVLTEMARIAPEWMEGCFIRPCYFEPTFHKHKGTLCQGFQMHTDQPRYQHERFSPYRLTALFFKAVRTLHADYDLWRKHAYEYETDRLPIDLINGGPGLREWVDAPGTGAQDFEQVLRAEEVRWREESRGFYIY